MTAAGAPPRILRPETVPVVGCDDHLPPVPADRLTAQALRRRFAEGAAPKAAAWQPEFAGDGRGAGGARGGSSAASVLVPLVQRDGHLTVLLTERAAHLRDHAGQISFPGGRAEPHDADAPATALREAEEEVGLAREQAEVIGQLPVYTTVTSFVVTPVVALVTPPLHLRLDAFEVARAFEVPLGFLMTPANHRRHVAVQDGHERAFLSMPWGDHFIWGATAAMLRNLYRFLSVGTIVDAPPTDPVRPR